MPHLTIPEEYASGLAHISVLPDAAIHELTLALSESPASLDVKDANAVTSLISTKVPTIPTKDLRRVMSALLSLYAVRVASDTPAEEFLDDVVRAMRRSKRPELSLDDPGTHKNFRNRLKTLLAFGSITAASKAIVLQHEHEHTLCTARIFTDARPVYGEDATSPPSAIVVTHMLKLTYHEGDRMEEIHIALDRADLLKLKTLIARAEEKATGLHRVFDSAHIPVVE
jgi:hypothetical protein